MEPPAVVRKRKKMILMSPILGIICGVQDPRCLGEMFLLEASGRTCPCLNHRYAIFVHRPILRPESWIPWRKGRSQKYCKVCETFAMNDSCWPQEKRKKRVGPAMGGQYTTADNNRASSEGFPKFWTRIAVRLGSRILISIICRTCQSS